MANTKDWFEATLRGMGLIVFSNKIITGYIVFFSILFISPMSALGGIFGSFISTLISYKYYKKKNFEEWKQGYFSYSSSILGIILGSYLVYSPFYFFIFIIAVIFCSLIDVLIKKILIKFSLPAFAVSAILTSWLVYTILTYNEKIFWLSFGALPLKAWSIYICILGIMLSLFLNNKKATLVTTIFTLLSIILSKELLNLSFYESSGLWAFNVATISYISSIVFLPLGLVGLLLIISSVLFSVLTWFIWIYSDFWQIIPPIIAPFTISILSVIFLTNKIFGPIIYSPNIWDVVNKIKKNKKICVITGAGVSTPSGIPDYVSGNWLDKKNKIEEYNFTNFLKFRKSRKIYWDVCYKFYKIYKITKHNIIHQMLSKLEKKKKFSSIVTQNVDGLHQSAGSVSVVELHGNISKVACVHCKKKYQWADIENQWQKKDIKCDNCLDFVKPSVIAMEQDLEPYVWLQAKKKVREAKLLLILGTQLSITSALNLLDIARKNKTKIIIINNSPVVIPLKKDEEILYFPLEKFFKILSCIL